MLGKIDSPQDAIARSAAVVGLGAVALIHVLDAPGTFQGSLYKGLLYVALIVGSMLTAGALIRSSDPRAWAAAVALPLGAAVAFVLSRTVGLPQGADDIGNWTESLGLASLFVEGSVVALGAIVLRERLASVPGGNKLRTWRYAELQRS
jgi:hypothetical protein